MLFTVYKSLKFIAVVMKAFPFLKRLLICAFKQIAETKARAYHVVQLDL